MLGIDFRKVKVFDSLNWNLYLKPISTLFQFDQCGQTDVQQHTIYFIKQ